jgi:hypothetical protein
MAGAGANLAAALGRQPRRRSVQVRWYDARGHAHLVDPDGDRGRRLADAADEMLRAAGDAPASAT